MSQNLSSTAIIYAILAINSEIDLQKEYLESEEVSVEDRNNESEILEELEQALMEFIDLYKLRLKSDKKLPSLDDLLNNPL